MKIFIEESTRKNKKYKATDGRKTVHFGDSRYSDFTQNHSDERKKAYIARHSKEDHTISNALSPAFLARHVLWSEKSVPQAVRKLNRKYSSVVQFTLK
jgi:hypothetical protein